MVRNYFELLNPSYNGGEFNIDRRLDPDSYCKELYEDLSEVLLKNKVLPNGDVIDIYETSLCINKKYYETRIKIKSNDEVIYSVGLGTDYIGASIHWALESGLSKKDCIDILKTSRTLGGHIFLPRWIREEKTNTLHRGISLNIAKGGKKGFCDRIDLFLKDLSCWYLKKECKLQEVYEKNKLWLCLFKNFDNFVKFNKLQDFIDNNYVENIQDIIPKSCDEYKEFSKNINKKINSRNFRLFGYPIDERTKM